MFLLLLSVIYFVWQNKNADHFNIKVNPPITESVGRMAITANGILKLKILKIQNERIKTTQNSCCTRWNY